MYGKAYQAETILRKKKRRPFAKEIINEVNDGEDLFKALFSQNIKDVKQKVKQDKTRSNKPHKKKISQRPIFAGIPEHPECGGSSDFLDPFDALLKDTRGHVEKNNVNVSDLQSKSGVEIHEDEKENSPEAENCLVLDHKKQTVVFESVFRGGTKKITEKPNSTPLKRHPLKLKSDRKGRQESGKVKEKLNPDSFLNLIDSSCDLDALEDEFKAKMVELRKKKEEHKIISQSKSSLTSASGCEKLCEDTCSENESYAVCSHSSSSNLCCNRQKITVNFLSSTPAKHASLTKPSRVNQNKHEQKRECSGSEDCHQLSTLLCPTQESLSCVLSPILCVTKQRLSSKTSHEQENEKICTFARLPLSSEENENQMNMKYWKEMYRKHNPVPVALEQITVQPFIHANYEDSGTDDNFEPDKSVKNFSDKKENICSLQQSPDPFADNSDLQEHFQTSTECLVKSETLLEEVCEQSRNTCERYCQSIENVVTQESDKNDRETLSSDSVKEETNQSKKNHVCKCISHVEGDYIGHVDSQNSLKENSAHFQDTTYSPSIKNVCFRRSYGSRSSKPEEKINTFSAINNSKPPLNSEIADSVMTSNCSTIFTELDASKRISEFIDTSSQGGSVCEKISKLSLSESRSSYKAMKKKSFSQRRSHLVVPLAQNMSQIYERTSGFREVYISTPLQRQCIDKNLSWWLPDSSPNDLKYDDDLDEVKKDGITFKDVVLEHCGQSDMLAFDEAFPESDLADCIKIGEGVYGEVFTRLNFHHQPTVLKIMPIEGDCQINGESQKSFEEILPEIVITAQLSKLRENEHFSTPNFPELIDCWCVQGKYPPKLLKLWQDYDEQKTSENDSPEILPQDQIFIILELSNVGSSLESFVFNSAEQSWSAFMQVTYTLAVAEASLEFEHRDLHWGNILIKRTTDKSITCKMYGEDQVVPAHGIQASVIDFTLSRITYDGCCIYNNLAEDPSLFEGEGDYQFDIYRMMRDKTENDWQVFQPYNNVLWLSYMLEKLITEVHYRNEKTKIHKRGIEKLKEMRSHILDFQSAIEVAQSFS